ncbi:MAG TPA: menaquinone biosynthesis protein [Pyrinomonadaceae bacterium]|nr:menaquinone biosynthesis protein [Pyrinomonadaceae bacterium]
MTNLLGVIAIVVERLSNKPRLAASSFLNSAPLIWSFIQGSRRDDVELIDAVPSRCADLLAKGEVDFALVPVIEYQRIANGKLVRDVCVASREKVHSVVLVSQKSNLSEILSVALDESSRTSATLVKILFKEFLGFEPKWTTTTPDLQQMLSENDAALIIGDPGMLFPRDRFHVWDMAELWRENTGLGFVFAMWMTGPTEADMPDFRAARDEGLAKIEEIVSAYASQTPMQPDQIRDYLSRNIVFQIDDDLLRGMEKYFQLAGKHELIPELKPINFS